MAPRAMTFPAPTRKHHQRFCLTEGWVQRRSSRGKTGTHHVNYEFTLPEGRVLLTRISHPVNRDTYGPRIWSHILRDQLAVTEGEFWDCVNDSVLPNRGAEPAVAPASAIPLGVVTALIEQFHVPESEVLAMTKDEAILRLSTLYSQL